MQFDQCTLDLNFVAFALMVFDAWKIYYKFVRIARISVPVSYVCQSVIEHNKFHYAIQIPTGRSILAIHPNIECNLYMLSVCK